MIPCQKQVLKYNFVKVHAYLIALFIHRIATYRQETFIIWVMIHSHTGKHTYIMETKTLILDAINRN